MESGRGSWTRIATVLLVITGGLLGIPGLLLASLFGWSVAAGAPDPCGALGCGWPVIFALLGAVLLCIGLVQLRAAVGIWQGKRWGRRLALVVVLPVLLLGTAGMALELAGRQSPASGLIAIPWAVMLFAVLRSR